MRISLFFYGFLWKEFKMKNQHKSKQEKYKMPKKQIDQMLDRQEKFEKRKANKRNKAIVSVKKILSDTEIDLTVTPADNTELQILLIKHYNVIKNTFQKAIQTL